MQRTWLSLSFVRHDVGLFVLLRAHAIEHFLNHFQKDMRARFGATLIVRARFDRIATPPVIERLVQSYLNCRFTNFEQAAHGVTIQCADEVNQLLSKHFLRVGARASSPHFLVRGRPRPLP